MSNNESIYSEHQTLTHDLQGLVSDVKDKKILQRYYVDNPYIVLGVAAAAGYVAAGGLFSPFTRRLVRIGMRAVFLPVALSKLSDITLGK